MPERSVINPGVVEDMVKRRWKGGNEGGDASQLNPKRAQATVVGVETNQLNLGGADVLDGADKHRWSQISTDKHR